MTCDNTGSIISRWITARRAKRCGQGRHDRVFVDGGPLMPSYYAQCRWCGNE